MQKYDAALKSVPRRGSSGFLSGLMGLDVATFLNVDLPDPRSLRPDLLGEAQDRTLFHVELQSSNDARMAFRMLDYLVAIERKYGCVPRQLVLICWRGGDENGEQDCSGRLIVRGSNGGHPEP